MRDRGRIVLGLLVFLALATFPIWYNQVSGGAEPFEKPVIPAQLEGTDCVLETDYMTTEHMQLLMDWRDEVVRDNERIFVSPGGERYYKSLSATCMSCHANKTEFCDRCHDYLSVKPYCWECHVEPKGDQ
jgi:hypothetical protein